MVLLKYLRKRVALQGDPDVRGERPISREEAEKAVLAIVVSQTISKLGPKTVRPETLWSFTWLMGPDEEFRHTAKRSKGLSAARAGGQSVLMDLWVDPVVERTAPKPWARRETSGRGCSFVA